MPHILVKLYTGRTEQQKQDLADAIAQAVTTSLQCRDSTVSVAIEDVAPDDWQAQVYGPEIVGQPDRLYRKPGY